MAVKPDKTFLVGLEQGRASYAFECAREGSQIGKRSKEYKSYVKKIPMLIKTNGLGSTIAYIESKKRGNQAYMLICEQIARWLKNENNKYLLEASEDQNSEDIAKRIVSLSSSDYRCVTAEILALFLWLRRFAEALIEGDAINEP